MTRGFIYFISMYGGYVKIGYTTNIDRRFEEIGAHMPGMRLLGHTRGTMAMEKKLHQRFAHLRERGEWFKLAPELRAFIKALPVPRTGSVLKGRVRNKILSQMTPQEITRLRDEGYERLKNWR